MKRRQFLANAALVPVAVVVPAVAASSVMDGVDWTTPAPVNIGKDQALTDFIRRCKRDAFYQRPSMTPLRYEDVETTMREYYGQYERD